jgi:uncharacterized membrane protein YqjE
MEDATVDGPGAGRPVDGLASRSTGELVQRLSEQVSRLVRQEVQLAKLELAEKGKRTGVGAGLIGGGGLFAAYGIATLVAAAVLGLATVWPAWLAALVVALLLLLIAGLLALVGQRQVKKGMPPVPTDAVASVKADVDEITTRARR